MSWSKLFSVWVALGLLEVDSPSGAWLRFSNDSEHRIRKIKSSSGRSVEYVYDAGGRMIRATDSDGHVDAYSYDDKADMLTASHADGKLVLSNQFFGDAFIKTQTMADQQAFTYGYFRDSNGIHENQIIDPNGMESYVEYGPGGYQQWLPTSPPH